MFEKTAGRQVGYVKMKEGAGWQFGDSAVGVER